MLRNTLAERGRCGGASPLQDFIFRRRCVASSAALCRIVSTPPAAPCRRRTPAPLCSGVSESSGAERQEVVEVDVGTAIERLTVQLANSRGRLLTVRIDFPLGLVLEEVNGRVRVAEVTQGGSADKAKVQVGDELKATTAWMMQMTYPPSNLLFGGVGRPKLSQILFPAAGQPFTKVMDAVRSNTAAKGGSGTVQLVVERLLPEPAEAFPSAAAGDAARQQLVDASEETSSLSLLDRLTGGGGASGA